MMPNPKRFRKCAVPGDAPPRSDLLARMLSAVTDPLMPAALAGDDPEVVRRAALILRSRYGLA